jgi:hypothetical protein
MRVSPILPRVKMLAGEISTIERPSLASTRGFMVYGCIRYYRMMYGLPKRYTEQEHNFSARIRT